jgi:hypothetical protein
MKIRQLTIAFFLLLTAPLASAQIAFVGGTAAIDEATELNSTNSITLTLPTHAAGHVGYLFAQNYDGSVSQAWNTVTDWTIIATATSTVGNDCNFRVWRRVFTSSSETNPTVDAAATSRKIAGVVVFSGVDNTTPEDGVTPTTDTASNLFENANAAITPATDNGTLLLLQAVVGATTGRLSTLGEPSGYTLVANGSGSLLGGFNYRDLAAAYDLDYGTSFPVTPGVWTHEDGGGGNAESCNVTIALRPAVAGSNPTSIILQQHW